MDMDLESYIKIYNNWISDDKCNEVIEQLKYAKWDKHRFYVPLDNSTVDLSGDKEFDVTHHDLEADKYIMQRLWDGYKKYILDDFNFPWFNSWNGFSKVRYNKYNVGQVMAQHCDHIHDMFDGNRKGVPILTALGCLNDDYEGGNLVMWDKPIKLRKGDLMIFPSNFLYPHKVEEVTKGERYSFVSWAW